MADNVAITAGSGTSIAADEISDGTLGSVKVQYVKLMDGTIDGTTKVATGTGTGSALRVAIDSSQLSALSTASAAMSAGYQLVALPSDQVKIPVQGNTAHDAADADKPMKVGHKATTALSGLTLVASGDVTDSFAGIDGVQIVRPHTGLEDIVSGNASNTDGTSTQVIAASGSGVKTYLTSVILTNTSSSNIYVEMKDGSTAKLTIPLPANSGAIFNPPVPIGGTDNTAWNFDPSAATTTVYCSAIGFKSKI